MPQRAAMAACLVLALVLVSRIIRPHNLVGPVHGTDCNVPDVSCKCEILPAEHPYAGPAALYIAR